MTFLALLAALLIQASPAPKFEVAAIKPCNAADAGGRRGGGRGRGGDQGFSPERLTVRCAPVTYLIQNAYGSWDGHTFNPFRTIAVDGGPDWIKLERYWIDAKAESPQSTGTMMGPMMRALLEDRFQLKIHRETRVVPVYALTVAKGGAKLQPAQEGSCISSDFEHLPPSEPGAPRRDVCGMGVSPRTGSTCAVSRWRNSASFSRIG
jgi:uncharacterized protein (TIGR03435 family)